MWKALLDDLVFFTQSDDIGIIRKQRKIIELLPKLSNLYFSNLLIKVNKCKFIFSFKHALIHFFFTLGYFFKCITVQGC